MKYYFLGIVAIIIISYRIYKYVRFRKFKKWLFKQYEERNPVNIIHPLESKLEFADPDTFTLYIKEKKDSLWKKCGK